MKKCLFLNQDFKLQSKHMMNKISYSYFTDKSTWPQMVYGKPRNTELIYPRYKNPTNQTEAQTKTQNKTKETREQKIPPENPEETKRA